MGWKEIPLAKVKELISKDLSEEVINELLHGKTLLINSDKIAIITSINHEVHNIFNELKTKGMQPLFLGSKVCDLTDGNARLNIELATKASQLKVPKITINQKSEQLFLYSRDVWSESITKTEGKIEKGKIAFIYNEQGLFLGLAFPLTDNILNQEHTTVLRNILDLGYYLRCEK